MRCTSSRFRPVLENGGYLRQKARLELRSSRAGAATAVKLFYLTGAGGNANDDGGTDEDTCQSRLLACAVPSASV